jgi:NADH-quinone oxidoreductase subunit G
MVKIEINGQIVEAHEGDMLIDVADDASIAIPRFCYHKKLSIAANCRMCLVEVEGAPKPLPACSTPVTDGMKVYTKSKKAIAAQQSVMEFLLINHPLDCPICDQGGECELQDVALEYGDDVSKYSESKRVVADKDIGPLIQTDMTRCIHCTRCVRFGQEVAGMMELGATGRSEWMQIGTYVAKSVSSEMSGNMIDLCPVGALTSKPFRYSARPWELTAHRSIAAHDSFGSHTYIHAKGNQVKRVVPAEKEDINEVWLSDRDRFSYEGINSEDRLTQPQIKIDGAWQTVDWQTALDFTADKLKKYAETAQEVGVLASANATLEELHLLQKLMRGLGVQSIDTRLRQIDFRMDEFGVVQPSLSYRYDEIENLKNIVLVGSYLRKELPMLNHRVRKAQLAGAKVIALNPAKFDFNYKVDQSLSNDPVELVHTLAGAVSFLLSSDGQTLPDWLEGVAISEEAEAFANYLKGLQSGAIFIGQIAQMDRNYSQIVKLCQMLAELTKVTVDVLPMMANEMGAYQVNAVPEFGGKDVSQMLTLGMKCFINYGIEPELDVQQGLKALDAMRDAECVINFTAFDSDIQRQYADVLLPIATWAETAGTFVNAMGQAQSFKMAVEPQGEVKAGWKVLRVLGNLCDLGGFDYTHSSEVASEVEALMTRKLDWQSLPFEVENTECETICVPLLPLYGSDPIVRRSPSLQAAHDAPQVIARVHSLDSDEVMIFQDGLEVTMAAKIDENIPEKVVLIDKGLMSTAGFHSGCAVVKPV